MIGLMLLARLGILRPVLLSVTLCALIVGCNSGGRSGPGDDQPAFAIQPYLTKVGAREAALNWRLDESAPSTLEYGTDRSFRNSIVSDATVQHAAVLTDLKPDTQYFYRVDNRFVGQFTTRPETDQSFRFAVVGHTHGTEGFDHYPDKLLVNAVDGLDPDFVIHTGDITYFSRINDYAQHYFDLFRSVASRIPIYIAPGNHEAGWPNVPQLTTFKQLFPYDYPAKLRNDAHNAHYAVDYGQVRFLFLSYTSDLRPESLQRRWLQEQIETAEDRLIIVAMGGAQDAYDRTEVLDFFADSGVDLVLQGDGPGGNMSYHDSLPVLFVGTGVSRPHYYANCEWRDSHLLMKLMDVTGTVHGAYWLYHDREHTPQQNLLELEYTIDRRENEVVYRFPIGDSGPDQISGVQFRHDTVGEKTWTTLARAVKKSGKSLRTQFHSFDRRDALVTLAFPTDERFTDSRQPLEYVSLIFRKPDTDTEIKLQAAWLY